MEDDRLAAYYTRTSRYSSQLGGRSGLRGQVDALLNELQIPATLDADGDWQLVNDAGNFTLFVFGEGTGEDKIIVRQKFNELGSNLRKHAGQLHGLLALNLGSEGAYFAVQDNAATGNSMIVLNAQRDCSAGIDRETMLELLVPAFELSRKFDQVVHGDEAPAPEPAQQPQQQADAWPPNWYADPRGEARLRYWDGAAWTEHTSA